MSETVSPSPARIESRSGRRPAILFLTTYDLSARSFLIGQLAALSRAGVRTVVATRDTGTLADIGQQEDVTTYDLPLERDPAPLRDIVGLIRTFRTIRAERPDVVVYGTPKAALLGALASWACRVPRRVFFLYGLRAETMTGLGRVVMILSEKLVAALSTESLSVGEGVRSRASELGIDVSEMRVIGRGSPNGVDVDLFESKGRDRTARRRLRERLGVDEQTTVLGFVGRVTPDKGIACLVEAASQLRAKGRRVHVMLVGPDEGVDRLPLETQRLIAEPWITVWGQVAETADVYAGFDIFCLPTRREGLPTVVLEACAARVPIVVSTATGMAEVIDYGRAGVMTPIDEPEPLAEAIDALLSDPAATQDRVDVASRFVRREFDASVVRDRMVAHYLSLLPHG